MKSQIIHVIDLSIEKRLSCGCVVSIGNLMTLIGHQVLRGEAVTCPYHLIEHNFSNNDIMKQYSVSYLKHCLKVNSEFLMYSHITESK